MYPVRCRPYDDMSNEIFLPITYPEVMKGYYSISNYGRVYSHYSDKFMSPFTDRYGYYRVGLVSDNAKRWKNYTIHRLVCFQFNIKLNPDGDVVNHIDCNKKNNYYLNLEYCDDLYNKNHAKNNSLMPRGVYNSNNKYSESEVIDVCKRLEEYKNPAKVVHSYGYTSIKQNISLYDLCRNIYNRNTWTHISKNYNF